MRLSDLKPSQNISPSQWDELWNEIHKTHAIMQTKNQRTGVIHCKIKRQYFKDEDTGKMIETDKNAEKFIDFYVVPEYTEPSINSN